MRGRAILPVIAASLTGCASIDSDPVAGLHPATVHCAPSHSLTGTGACEVLSLGKRNTVILGTVLADNRILNNGSVLIDNNGLIVDVGCDAHKHDLARDATVLACPGGIVSPGFINAHDHIWYNHRSPSKLTDERYEHRHQWRLGLEGKTQPDYERAERSEQVAWGEIRHALSGTTSIAGMGGVPGFVRNLEDSSLSGDLKSPAAFTTVFPLGDASGTMLAGSCEYPGMVDPSSLVGAGSFQAHVAEGVDRRAANEIACVTGRGDESIDVTSTPSSFVHFIAASPADADFLRERRASVVWSPRSNLALYGHTANVTMLDRLNVNMALSTDWLPSGSMNLLRELHCAADFSENHLNGYFSYFDLWKMVTSNAARSFSLQGELGSIAEGQLADIAIFRDGPASDPYEDIVNASDADVLLVLQGGRPLLGRTELIDALGADCDTLPKELTCGDDFAICTSPDGGALAAILAANQDSYPLMSCGFVPDGEPVCSPSWPGQFDGKIRPGIDDDGDGVNNDADNCPTVFNPPRPMDGDQQADWDRDLIGDACDDSPLE